MTEEHFTPQEVSYKELDRSDYFTDENKMVIVFDKSVEYLLVEEYGPDCYNTTDDGKLKFSVGYTNKEYIIKWILGFGDSAKVLEPAELADEIRQKAKNIYKSYEHDI